VPPPKVPPPQVPPQQVPAPFHPTQWVMFFPAAPASDRDQEPKEEDVMASLPQA
jgi:hypothetical protein